MAAEGIEQMTLDLDSESGDDDDDWEDIDDEDTEEEQPTRCLFCTSTFPKTAAALHHCHVEHDFNIKHIVEIYSLDCFGYIKMINYIRKHHPPPADVNKGPVNGAAPWDSDDYMRPEIEDDPLLQFDIEEMEADIANGTSGGDVVSETEVRLSSVEYRNLLDRLRDSESRAKHAEDQIEHLMTDLTSMREVAQSLVLSGAAQPVPSHQAVQNLQDDDDDIYFGSYSHFSIHHEMLQDKVRTECYRDSIMENRDVFKDKLVLDVGCGTGVLSMFAAKAGARRVIGIDMADIIYQAMDIVRENKLENVITLIKGRVEDINLPVEKVDIIISEWMGYFLLFESMLDTVLYARDKWLAPGGKILPNRCNISLSGLADADLHGNLVMYWNDVYGLKMSCMKSAVVQEATVKCVKSENIITDAFVIKDIDIHTCSLKDLEFRNSFKLKASRSGFLTALVGYFDIWFECLPNKVFFSTGPSNTPTHWKQTLFIFENPVELKQGEEVDGQLVCKKNRKDPRSLKITISMKGKIYTFHMQ